jgi:hypothetical protein
LNEYADTGRRVGVRVHLGAGAGLSACWRFEELGFEISDASVLEADVGAGGFEAFVHGPNVRDELLGGDPLDGSLGPLGLRFEAGMQVVGGGVVGRALGQQSPLLALSPPVEKVGPRRERTCRRSGS